MIATTQPTKVEAWFDDMIATLKAHQLQLETNTADPGLKQFYDKLFGSNENEMAHLSKAMAQKYFIPKIIVDYIQLLAGERPLKIAFDYNDAEVLVWAEIEEGDVEMERKLLKAEAVVNAKYHDFGFDMETTIVEQGDRLPVPNHYKVFS